MIGSLKVVTKPAILAAEVADAKSHLGVTHDEDSRRLYELVELAVDRVQSFTSRQLVTATYDYYLDQFPSGRVLELPLAPLSSVTSVKYQDLDDAQQTFASSNYDVFTRDDEPGFVELKQDKQWESTYDKSDAVVVRFVCGYGTDRLAVPAPLRQATLLYTQVDYDPVADRAQIERAAEDLMWPFRLAEVG